VTSSFLRINFKENKFYESSIYWQIAIKAIFKHTATSSRVGSKLWAITWFMGRACWVFYNWKHNTV